MRSFFITGTDTDAGKTYCTKLIIEHLQAVGKKCKVHKPVAAGCYEKDNQWLNDDAVILKSTCQTEQSYFQINPITIKDPIAPHIGAEEEKIDCQISVLQSHYEKHFSDPNYYNIVEGAGGWMVPLNDRELFSDYVKKINLEVILVVGLKLGCLNHTLLTINAIKQNNIKIAGWIVNHLSPTMEKSQENIHYLKKAVKEPFLGEILFNAKFEKSNPILNIDYLT